MWSSWDQDSKESFISYFRKQFIFYVITELVPPPISEFPVAEAHFLFSFKGTFGVVCWVLSNQCYQNCSQSRRSIKVPRTVLTSPLSFLPKPRPCVKKMQSGSRTHRPPLNMPLLLPSGWPWGQLSHSSNPPTGGGTGWRSVMPHLQTGCAPPTSNPGLNTSAIQLNVSAKLKRETKDHENAPMLT